MFLRCTICGASNALPASRLIALPRCVRCRQPVPAPAVALVTDAAELAEVTRDAPWPVLIDLWSSEGVPGAGRDVARELDTLARRHQGHLLVLKVNVAQVPDLLQQLQVSILPTFLLYDHGREIRRLAGLADAARLESALIKAA